MIDNIRIKKASDRKRYMELLLLADEEEKQILKYIDLGTLYVMEASQVIGVCLVIDIGDGILEIKNLAIKEKFQKQGYGKLFIDFLINTYKDRYRILQVGTGDSPLTVPFYKKCGFTYSHSIKNFFLDNYSHPIIECGVQLQDMVYFRLELMK